MTYRKTKQLREFEPFFIEMDTDLYGAREVILFT